MHRTKCYKRKVRFQNLSFKEDKTPLLIGEIKKGFLHTEGTFVKDLKEWVRYGLLEMGLRCKSDCILGDKEERKLKKIDNKV